VYYNLVAQKRDTPKQEATVTSSSGCRVALQQWSVSEINSLVRTVTMETLVEKITDEHAAIDLGAVAAANIPDLPKQKSGTIRFIKKSAPVIASAAEADLISDLVHQIENLKASDAKARLVELEDAHEKTYFEIGGVLSVMQKGKWYDPCASLDEWVEKNTGMSKARALIQIYNAVVNSRVTWAQVKHIKWTRLRAIARVLDKENADHWIGIASKGVVTLR
jgi:hypothetical protein